MSSLELARKHRLLIAVAEDVLDDGLHVLLLVAALRAFLPVATAEPLLAALPGITVTPDVPVSVQDTPESSPSPTFAKASRNFASSETIRKSQAKLNDAPAPAAVPAAERQRPVPSTE